MNKPPPQLWPHGKISQYTSIKGCSALEIGGNKSCYAASAFIKDEACRVVVSELGHVGQEDSSKIKNIELVHTDAFDIVDKFGRESFDFVYGVSILEHIPSTARLLEKIYEILKPGGMVYLQGNPLWSSALGHHVWMTPWDHGTTQCYFFDKYPGLESINPIPDWGHLLMQPDEMATHLDSNAIPKKDVQMLVDALYVKSNINRLTAFDLAEAFSSSKFTILEANAQSFREIPSELRTKLWTKYGDHQQFGYGGVEYVLVK